MFVTNTFSNAFCNKDRTTPHVNFLQRTPNKSENEIGGRKKEVGYDGKDVVGVKGMCVRELCMKDVLRGKNLSRCHSRHVHACLQGCRLEHSHRPIAMNVGPKAMNVTYT